MPRKPTPTLSSYVETWMEERVVKRSYYQDRLRWHNHWETLVGHLEPNAVILPVIKDALRTLRAKGLSNSSIKLCFSLLSVIYSDLVEDGLADINPVSLLGRKSRNEFLKSSHDSHKVPFLADPSSSLNVWKWLKERNKSVATAYAIGAFAGLRTGEIRALKWSAIDAQAKIIAVTCSVEKRTGRPESALSEDGLSPPKSGFSRIVPIFDVLMAILVDVPRGDGLVCPGIDGNFLGEPLIGKLMKEALKALGLPQMTFYQGTRHSCASQWVISGGNIHTLSRILGHSTSQITEKNYVHMVPGRYTDEDRSRVAFAI